MKMNMGIIELEGMEFKAYHGCLEQERKEGNLFTVDFKAEYDIEHASMTDCLDDTLDYGKVYDIISGQMKIPSNLLENVAGRIREAVALAFPALESFSIRVSKQNPPVSGPAHWSRVTLYYKK